MTIKDVKRSTYEEWKVELEQVLKKITLAKESLIAARLQGDFSENSEKDAEESNLKGLEYLSIELQEKISDVENGLTTIIDDDRTEHYLIKYDSKYVLLERLSEDELHTFKQEPSESLAYKIKQLIKNAEYKYIIVLSNNDLLMKIKENNATGVYKFEYVDTRDRKHKVEIISR